MRIIQIGPQDEFYIQAFLKNAGSSLEHFRYFSKRPTDVIRNHLCTFIGLNDKDEVIAYGHLDPEDGKTWLGIAIADTETAKGYGSLMMRELIQYAHRAGVKQINLSVDNDNIKAIGLYRKLGFRLIEKREQISLLQLDCA